MGKGTGFLSPDGASSGLPFLNEESEAGKKVCLRPKSLEGPPAAPDGSAVRRPSSKTCPSFPLSRGGGGPGSAFKAFWHLLPASKKYAVLEAAW